MNKTFRTGWKLPNVSLSSIQETLDELIKIIVNANKPLHLEELLTRFKAGNFYNQNNEQLADLDLLPYLQVSSRLDQNIFDEWGLLEWPAIRPRRVRDKAYLILKQANKPLHFTEIVRLINEAHFDKKTAYPATVHNELILDKRFVLVGRGIYAMLERGYQRGTVADVAENILKAAHQPLTKEEIVGEVLKQRLVEKNTVCLALTNKERFKRLADNRYELAQKSAII